MWAGLREGSTEGYFVSRGDSGNPVTTTATIAEDQWYVVRVSQVGFVTSISVDGTLVATYRSQPAVVTDPVLIDKFMLYALSGQVDYRNIKVWRLDGPA